MDGRCTMGLLIYQAPLSHQRLCHHSLYIRHQLLSTVRYRYNAASFLENPHNRHPISRLAYGVPFVSTNFDLCNVWAIAVSCKITCYISSHYNGTRLYRGGILLVFSEWNRGKTLESIIPWMFTKHFNHRNRNSRFHDQSPTYRFSEIVCETYVYICPMYCHITQYIVYFKMDTGSRFHYFFTIATTPLPETTASLSIWPLRINFSDIRMKL